MPRIVLPVFLACTLIVGCGAKSNDAIPNKMHAPARFEHLAPYGPSTLPFSPAVRVGDVLYLSGQIGNRRGDTSGVVPGGIEAETRQSLENIKDLLERSG